MGLAAAASGTGPAPVVGGPGNGTATGTGPVAAEVKLRAQRHVRVGNPVAIRGRVTPSGARAVVIKVGDRKVRTVHSDREGSFRARWRASGAGVYRVTAVARGTGSARRAESPPVRVNAYRAAAASYYGPGLYGGGLACGGTLRPGTIGVANRSLACGTRLTLRYGRRSVRVEVIDRGPFSGHREFDLTAATRARLGFPSTGIVLSTR
ncbi:MAG: septal ring lytic transglycosylase RlpA family protein [Solirubrobacterales bacterium]